MCGLLIFVRGIFCGNSRLGGWRLFCRGRFRGGGFGGGFVCGAIV